MWETSLISCMSAKVDSMSKVSKLEEGSVDVNGVATSTTLEETVIRKGAFGCLNVVNHF